jgi:hypothetical protein
MSDRTIAFGPDVPRVLNGKSWSTSWTHFIGVIFGRLEDSDVDDGDILSPE